MPPLERGPVYQVPMNDTLRMAKRVRGRIIRALHAAGGGHFGGSLSVVDMLVAIYSLVARSGLDWDDPARDRIVLSKGHAAIALYAILAELNRIDPSLLPRYGSFNSGLEGHPDMLITPGVDFSSGSLGQGLAVGIGMALALADSGTHTWVVLGDGECQEGQVWESAMIAARYRLRNLTVIIDANGAQETGFTSRPELNQEPIPDMLSKWQAFGWNASLVNGHDIPALTEAFLHSHKQKEAPSVWIALTRKGAGVPFFEEDSPRYHCTELSENEFKRALELIK
jgi:transketolase